MTFEEAMDMIDSADMPELEGHEFLKGIQLISKYTEIEPDLRLTNAGHRLLVGSFSEEMTNSEVEEMYGLGFVLDREHKSWMVYVVEHVDKSDTPT